MDRKVKIAVSIVSFNTKDLLKKCLDNILEQKTKYPLEVWVVDNASSDDSVRMLEESFSKKIQLIKSKDNNGFSAGHNLALKKMSADIVFLLNPDTELPDDALEKMTDFMLDHPDCGIASCPIYDYSGNLQSNGGDLPFSKALISWLFNLEWLFPEPNFHRVEEDYYQQEREVGWVGGTFMGIKKEVFKKVGYLNEEIFMYFEDTEFCYLATKAGFKVMINPEVSIKRIGGASSTEPRYRQWLGEFRGVNYFYHKYFDSFTAFLVSVLVYIAIILRVVGFGLKGNLDISKTYGKILFKI